MWNEKREKECFRGFDHLGQGGEVLDLDGSIEIDEGFKEGMRSML